MNHSKDFLDLVQKCLNSIREISIDDTLALIKDQTLGILIDTREDHEWENGHLPQSIHLSKGIIERDILSLCPDKEKKIVLYCGGGFRSAIAAHQLQKMGYSNVFSMQGGIREWRERGLPEAKPPFCKLSGQLFMTPRSPFARRIRLAIKRFALPISETIINPFEPDSKFLEINPLGQVPTLNYEISSTKNQELKKGTLFDSDTILLWFEKLGLPIWGTKKDSLVFELTLSRLACGIMTSSVAYFLESQKTSPDLPTLDDHTQTVQRSLLHALDLYHNSIPTEIDQGLLDLGVALEYVYLRLPQIGQKIASMPLAKKVISDCAERFPFYSLSAPPPVDRT